MAVRRLAPKEQQPANFTFSAENLAWAKQQIAKYPEGRQASAVIPILWRVQEQHDGWVSEAAIRAVADLLDDGRISPRGKYLIKLDVEGVEIEAIKGGTRLLRGDSVVLCEEHGNDRNHTVSRYILEQTPLKLMVHDPRSNRLETVTELSILDRIKVSTHVGYNVFGTASAFWEDRIDALNANATRRLH